MFQACIVAAPCVGGKLSVERYRYLARKQFLGIIGCSRVFLPRDTMGLCKPGKPA